MNLEHLIVIHSGSEKDDKERFLGALKRCDFLSINYPNSEIHFYVSGANKSTEKYLTPDYSDDSKSTLENVYKFGKFILNYFKEHNSFPEIDVITSSYHTARVRNAFENKVNEIKKITGQKIHANYFGVPADNLVKKTLKEMLYLPITCFLEATKNIFLGYDKKIKGCNNKELVPYAIKRKN